jgi:hypothetical protein
MKATPNNSFNRSGISLPFIREIEGCSAILPARLIRALDTLRKNKTAEPCESQAGRANAALNGTSHGRSNNSFNASGISMDVIREIGCLSHCSPPR